MIPWKPDVLQVDAQDSEQPRSKRPRTHISSGWRDKADTLVRTIPTANDWWGNAQAAMKLLAAGWLQPSCSTKIIRLLGLFTPELNCYRRTASDQPLRSIEWQRMAER